MTSRTSFFEKMARLQRLEEARKEAEKEKQDLMRLHEKQEAELKDGGKFVNLRVWIRV